MDAEQIVDAPSADGMALVHWLSNHVELVPWLGTSAVVLMFFLVSLVFLGIAVHEEGDLP
jgi:hypothetical protein